MQSEGSLPFQQMSDHEHNHHSLQLCTESNDLLKVYFHIIIIYTCRKANLKNDKKKDYEKAVLYFYKLTINQLTLSSCGT
jgi:hypothetical protein